ncbi:putative pilus assembly protein FilE [Acinetobacter venetianus]|uniref:putative pilus assembly protein FilE n=1 Tax=Acinetobacter venetianus TaxID=52133 RepID=UPI0007787720|nr:putative pilus assembly protein FilE [Acinetobacter venetianus]KXZ65888.1 hypothetical protein AVENLUH7437_01131 [Acinetobacter venetianus]
MQKNRNQRSKLPILIIFIGFVSGSNLYADGFYTIIGPDGRPMIVPKKDQEKVLKIPVKESVEGLTPSIDPISKKDVTAKEKRFEVTPIQPLQQNAIPTTIDKGLIQPAEHTNKNQDITPAKNQVIKTLELPNTSIKSDKQIAESAEKLKGNTVPVVTKKMSSEIQDGNNKPFTDIDGVKYVNNEYLEDQEFNLEGKKRFYTMPDGSGRFETIERKKGVSRSMLDRIMNRSLDSNKPITLAESYMRLSAQDLALAFENDRCFLEDYSKSIKKLTPKKEIGIWPRKPLKEKFEYELIELDSSIRYVQMDSFASSIESPVYYWPLVVFLDEKGCINEGVSGFKNATVNTSLFKHAAIQGTLRVPSNTRYLMMTPLASAVDVPEKELSNQGQINLSVLQ